jgi:hypothetical protein
VIEVKPATLAWMEALIEGDRVFTERFGIPVVPGWAGFPEAVSVAVDGLRSSASGVWGTHLFFDNGELVGFGGLDHGAPPVRIRACRGRARPRRRIGVALRACAHRLRLVVFSSMVVNDAPDGMLLPHPIAAHVSASATTAGQDRRHPVMQSPWEGSYDGYTGFGTGPDQPGRSP